MKRKNLSDKLLIVFFVLSFQSTLLKAVIHQPQLQIPSVSASPVTDGKIDEAVWQKSTVLSEFVNWSLDNYIKDKVAVFLCHDNKNLYVAFRNEDPEAAELNKSTSPKGPWDTFLWGRNHVAVTIEANGTSVRMMADPKGTQTDWKNDDISWNGDWVYNAQINKSDWTAEYSIPLSIIGITGNTDNTVISLGLSRSFPKGESSNWSGTAVLAGSDTPIVSYGNWPDPVPGKNKITFSAQNPESKELTITLETELIQLTDKPEFVNQSGQGPSSDLSLKINSEPLVYKSEYKIPAGGSISKEAEFELPHEGSYFASATVKAADGSVIRRSVDFWFTIETNRNRITDLRQQIGESIAAMNRVANPVSEKYKAEAESILASLKSLEIYADTAWLSGKWNDLTQKLNQKETEIARHLHKVKWASLHNWAGGDDFGIALTSPVLKLRKDALFTLPLNDRIEISVARNEYESFQLAVLPFEGKAENLNISVSDLEGPEGSVIPAKEIELDVVGYNMIDWQSDYVAQRKGWHPDPLLPLKGNLIIDPDDVCRPVWITVYASPETKPGLYRGTVTVGSAGSKSIKATILCRVWDFALPVESHLKTHSWDEINYISDFYNLDELPVEWYQSFCDVLLKHRFNPGSAGVNYVSQVPDKKGKYDFSKVEKVLGYCIDRGLDRFSIIQMKKGLYKPGEEDKIYRFIEAYTKFLKSKGWLDKALVELWDEPTDLEWPYIKERAERLKKIDPDLRLQLFAEGGPYNFWERSTDKYGLNNLINIWAPVNIIESPETQAKGGEIWTYFCTLARESAPNFYIDCPAIYQRSIAWYCWMFGVNGFEHWSTNYFWRNVKKGEPMDQKWPNVPWDSRTYYYFNGEGQLVYPGANGATYSSIRLENFRDGMDDYEYLYKLRTLLDKFSANTSDPVLNEYRQLLRPEDYLIYKYPRKIKVTLENTLRYPDQPELILETRQKIAEAIEDLQHRECK
jgi:hypothetical protein